jgi:hypothetical protein
MTRRDLFGTTAVAALAAPAPAAPNTPIPIGTRREIFVDRDLIADLRGVELRAATPIDRGPALQLDRPWEGPFSTYTTFLKDGDLYRIYYRGNPGPGGDGRSIEVTCCAESRDGVHWTRPALDLFPARGESRTNMVLAGAGPYSHNFCPFLDTRPGVPAAERYKAVAGNARTGLAGWVSADGLRWKKLHDEPVLAPLTQPGLDSQNLAFWSESEKQYVLYYRTMKKVGNGNYRWVSRAVSPDFRRFTPAGEMDFGDAPPEHLYTSQTSSYFRAPHIYIGLCARFMPGRQVLTEEQAKAVRVDPKYFKDCSDAVLISSRGGNTSAPSWRPSYDPASVSRIGSLARTTPP